ncbi:MAG: cytochrome-c oxidase, cbb3-type subunit III [Betaproteobacteria bacterium]|nr:cytochrome-c oxidase, cbb3-type subunit III [Betaproteobacteria bacterium]
MSQFTSDFWDVYIAVVSVVSIVACAVFLRMQSVRKVPAKVETGGTKATTGHTWDEDLAEYNNPLPRWWSWLFYLTVIFSLIYLVLYPGLGSWPGTLGWTQVGQLEQEIARAESRFGPTYEKFAAMDVKELSADPQALAVGEKLFLNNCAQCHASDARGSRGFPSLADMDWLWGGSPEAIRTSITEGRVGTMPAWGEALGEQRVKDIAHYVLSLSGGAHDSIRAARGKEDFAKTCVACHGAQGKGNPAMGAPDLTDKVWLHGGSEERIIETVSKGRVDQMPAHKDKLSSARIQLLTAYVYSLSRSGAAMPHRK